MSTAQKPPDPYIGRSVLNGQFLIEQKIGSGGMGAVYRASQPAMNRLVAVKILHQKLANRKDLVSRFRREARAMSHLTHPNTVKVLLYGELEDGALYIVMEYLEGKNLNQIVRKEGPLPVDRAVSVLVQCCGALQEAHTQGIIHRDLKPENIFVCTNGGLKDYAKVLDFGLAKVTERELRPGSIMLTQEGMVFGTPEFMSPEQAQGKKLDARSDIYSLATILYEVLTGKLPFDAKTPMEFIQLHVTKAPIPLDDRIAGKKFPPGLGEVIAKALEKKPEDRFASSLDFAEALRRFAPGARISDVVPRRAVEPTQVEAAMPVPPGLAATAPANPVIPVASGSNQGRMGASIDGKAKTLRMDPAAHASAALPSGMVRAPAGPASGGGTAPLGVPAPLSTGRSGIKKTTLALVALGCLVLGVVLTVAVIFALR